MHCWMQLTRFNGATLRTRGIPVTVLATVVALMCFNGATLRTRGIRCSAAIRVVPEPSFNGATLRTRGIRVRDFEIGGYWRWLQWGHA